MKALCEGGEARLGGWGVDWGCVSVGLRLYMCALCVCLCLRVAVPLTRQRDACPFALAARVCVRGTFFLGVSRAAAALCVVFPYMCLIERSSI